MPAAAADPYDLERFVRAQETDYARALAELRGGRKASHWMWYIFPQLRGLGHSSMARHFGITGAEEARAYLAHHVLGPRLRECASVVHGISGRTAHEIFGSPDDMKLRSSVTLFAHVSDDAIFRQVLEKYFDGKADDATLELLRTIANNQQPKSGDVAQ